MKNHQFFIILIIILISCQPSRKDSGEILISDKIRINQIGYEVNSPKRFIVSETESETFEIINESGDVIQEGVLSNRGKWESSGESVKMGDFSTFNNHGTYRIRIEDEGSSYLFQIGNNLYLDAAIDGLKSFYLQRMTMDIDQKFAGVYQRPGGHPDTVCYFHESTGRSSGPKSSPGGWYDAGDYGKYIVNAGVTVGTMLALNDINPHVFQDGSLWIPESGNGKNDLLDEIKFELDWMKTMQDDDGGVFHKLTTKRFEGFVMPVEAVNDRYIIGKSTAAALDFAANMAMASRLYKDFDSVFAETCLEAAAKAWSWAMRNPEEYYPKNPEDIHTGAYNDVILDEEFFWAAAELYISTGEEKYYDSIKDHLSGMEFRVEESWRNYVDNIGYYSLLTPKSPLSETDKNIVKDRLISLADSLAKVIENQPYRIPVDHFKWGSNSDFLNAAVLFTVAHHYTGNLNYKESMYETLDYIFGKNATGYSFVTGFGSKTPMHIHHRQSEADGILDPFPGFVVGGPNISRQDEGSLESAGKKYGSPLPARSYIDEVESFASNEICINWNAPYIFVLGLLVDTSDENLIVE
jgi:endoglucanase